MGNKRIQQAELDQAHRQLQREVAAMIVHAMGSADLTFEELDKRIGEKEGFARAYVHQMIDGKSDVMREVSDIAHALGVKVGVSYRPLQSSKERE